LENLLEKTMPRGRGGLSVSLSILLSIVLVVTPALGNPALGLGTVVSADRAHVGTAAASAGSTVFAGDKLDTEQAGSLQIRSGAARLVLTGSTRVIWGTDGTTPSATLAGGTAAFSTANARAFVLHAGTAVLRPRDNEPMVANVTLLNPKELVVRCSRGALLIGVDDDVRVVPEGTAYHVLLDPDAAIPAGAVPGAPSPTSWGHQNQPPIKAGKSKFIWYAIAFTAIVTGIAIWEASESPDRP
jgi:hypothetical protein